jgi:hypothetical protein
MTPRQRRRASEGCGEELLARITADKPDRNAPAAARGSTPAIAADILGRKERRWTSR